MNFLGKYMQIKKRNAKIAWKKAKMSKTCYLFLLPYLIVFTAFYILPVLMSVFYSFTYYNVLEPARFVCVEKWKWNRRRAEKRIWSLRRSRTP